MHCAKPSESYENRSGLIPGPKRPVTGICLEYGRHQSRAIRTHLWPQAVLADRGLLRVDTPDASYLVLPGHLLWIEPNLPHRAFLLEPSKIYSLFLTENFHQTGVFGISSFARELCRRLCAPSEPDIYDSLVRLLFAELRQVEWKELGVPVPTDRKLLALCGIFLKNPLQTVKLGDLCRSAGLSESAARRLFLRELGTNFSAWKTKALFVRAVQLSLAGQNAAQIGLELGYSSPAAFSAMMRRFSGKTARGVLRY